MTDTHSRYPAEVGVGGDAVGGASVVTGSIGGASVVAGFVLVAESIVAGSVVAEPVQVASGTCSIADGPVPNMVNGKTIGKKQNLNVNSMAAAQG